MTCSAVAFRAVRSVRFAGSVVIVPPCRCCIGSGRGRRRRRRPAGSFWRSGTVEARSIRRPASMIAETALAAAAKPLVADAYLMSSSRSARARASNRVGQVAHVCGEVDADRAFAPHAGLARDDRQKRRRFHDSARFPPPHAFQRHDVFAVHAPQLDVQSPDASPDEHGMPFRAGEVPVAVDQDRAGAVRFRAPPVACVERRARRREHVIQVRFEQVAYRHGLAVVLPSRDRVAFVQPCARRRVPSLGRRFGHHQVAAHEPDRVLDAALLVARIRVAEPGLEPVMRTEQGEQAR